MVLLLVTMEENFLRISLLFNEDIPMLTGDRTPFGCLVGGYLDRDRPNPLIFLVREIFPCGILFKYIVVMGLVVDMVFF